MGYDAAKPAAIYLLERPGQNRSGRLLKVGITGSTLSRMRNHRAQGWCLLEMTEPLDGYEARAFELRALHYLDEIGVARGHAAFPEAFAGYTEAWHAGAFPVETLAELAAHAGIPLPLPLLAPVAS